MNSTYLRDVTRMHRQSGSFWMRYFTDADKMHTLYQGATAYLENSDAEKDALVDSAKIESTPLTARKQWVHLQIPIEDFRQDIARYGDGSVYGQVDLVYGGLSQTAWLVDTHLLHASALVDNVGDTQMLLVRGPDFDVRDGQLLLRRNPATLPAVRKVGDRQVLDIWAFGASLPANYLYDSWGCIFGLRAASSPRYRLALQALNAAHILGPTRDTFSLFVCAMFDVPCVTKEATVEVVAAEWVGTSEEVIAIPDGAEVTVSVGERVYPGTPITNRLRLGTLAQVALPYVEIPAVLQPLGGSLVFPNEEVSVTAEYVDDEVFVTFPTGGDPEHDSAFFEQANATAPKLRHVLDRRNQPTGEPTPDDIVQTANPYELVANYAADRIIAVQVKTNNTLDSYRPYVRYIRSMLPPTSTALFALEDDQGGLHFESIA